MDGVLSVPTTPTSNVSLEDLISWYPVPANGEHWYVNDLPRKDSTYNHTKQIGIGLRGIVCVRCVCFPVENPRATTKKICSRIVVKNIRGVIFSSSGE